MPTRKSCVISEATTSPSTSPSDAERICISGLSEKERSVSPARERMRSTSFGAANQKIIPKRTTPPQISRITASAEG